MKLNHITKQFLFLLLLCLFTDAFGQEVILNNYLRDESGIALYKGKPYTGTTITLNNYRDQIASNEYKNGVIHGLCWHYDAERNLIRETYDNGLIIKWEFFDDKKNKLLEIDTLNTRDEIKSINIYPLMFAEYNDTIKKEQLCANDNLKLSLAVVMVNINDKIFTHVLKNWDVIYANIYSFPKNEWELKGSLIKKELISKICTKSTQSISMDNIKIKIRTNPKPDLIFPYHAFLLVD